MTAMWKVESGPSRTGTGVWKQLRLVVEHHRHSVPAFVAAELERLYENPYSCLHKLVSGSDSGAADKISTYVVRQDGIIITLWLYRDDGAVAQVLNELIEVSQADALRFSQSLFRRDPRITAVTFHAIRSKIRWMPYVFQQYNHLEDIVVQLPGSADDYLAYLGKSFRKTIKSYRNKLVHKFPDFQYQVLDLNAASEEQIRAVIELNRIRMSQKHKNSYFDEITIQHVLRMCRYCGLVGIATANGRICGGTIAWCIGRQYYIQVVSHDIAFDSYRLGNLVAYLSLVDCIQRGGSEAHLLWGRYEFKYSLRGVTRDLDKLVIYRSYLAFLLHPRLALSTAVRGWCRRYFLWIHQSLHGRRALPHALRQISHWLRAHARRTPAPPPEH